MNLQHRQQLRGELRQWKHRQKQDGILVWLMVVVSLFPVVNHVVSPSVSSKLVMALLLVGLGAVCLRLLNSAAKVVTIRQLITSSQEMVAVETISHSDIQPNSGRRNLN